MILFDDVETALATWAQTALTAAAGFDVEGQAGAFVDNGAEVTVTCTRTGGSVDQYVLDRAVIRVEFRGRDELTVVDVAGAFRSMLLTLPNVQNKLADGIELMGTAEQTAPAMVTDLANPNLSRYVGVFEVVTFSYPVNDQMEG